MLVMAGCMIESSLGITAAAQFAPLLDCADFDGAALVANDPYVGATIDGGVIRLPSGPGLGVVSRQASARARFRSVLAAARSGASRSSLSLGATRPSARATARNP